MQLRVLKATAFIGAMCLWGGKGIAQVFGTTDCSKAIHIADRLYNDGQLESVRGVLEPCLNERTAGEESGQAYRLLANAYLAMDKIDSARMAYLELLRSDPVFVPNPEAGDLYEMIWLSTQFKSTPFLSVGISLDLKPYWVSQVTSRSLHGLQKSGESEFNVPSTNLPLSVSAHVVVPVGRRFELLSGVSLNKFDFEQTYEFDTTDPIRIGNEFCSGRGTFRGVEEQKSVSVPLAARFYFLDVNNYVTRRTQPFRMYLLAGLDLQFLTSAKKISARTSIEDAANACSRGINDINLRHQDLRAPLNIATQAGIGTKFPLDRHQIFMEMVYSAQLLDQSKQGTPDTPYDQISFVDDSVRMHSIIFRLGAAFSFYRPKMLK